MEIKANFDLSTQHLRKAPDDTIIQNIASNLIGYFQTAPWLLEAGAVCILNGHALLLVQQSWERSP